MRHWPGAHWARWPGRRAARASFCASSKGLLLGQLAAFLGLAHQGERLVLRLDAIEIQAFVDQLANGFAALSSGCFEGAVAVFRQGKNSERKHRSEDWLLSGAARSGGLQAGGGAREGRAVRGRFAAPRHRGPRHAASAN